MTIDELIAFAGGVSKLAESAKCDRVTIYGWRRRGRVPVERARDISGALDLPLHEIRPDVWPAEVAAAE
jgi:hypothetical protein